ncbi:hypothetical protein [Fusibacter sp. JL216-2]|uniref:hypothetical protein n=1 Tax=Fusibacter sp. JL216-2 TaxID=3071453 RepID=UPI003D3423D4
MDESTLYKISKDIVSQGTCDYDDVDNLYSRLRNIISNLTESKYFKFDFDHFSILDKTEFISYFINLLDSEFDILGVARRNAIFPNRKLISNLNRIDADFEYLPLIEYFLQSKYPNEIDILKIKSEFDPIGRLRKVNDKTREIRTYEVDSKEKFNEIYMNLLSSYNKTECFSSELNDDYFSKLITRLFEIDTIEQGFVYVLFQTINYKFVTNSNLSNVERLDKLKLIEAKINDMYEEYSSKETSNRNQNIIISFIIYIFFMKRRNQYKTEASVQEILESQFEEKDNIFNPIDEEYQCKQRYLSDFEDDAEIMNIILEGSKERPKRFEENLNNSGELCDLLSNYAGRQLNKGYLQHIKVVYREMILDKVKFDNRNARTILRNISKSDEDFNFEKFKESIFINEKISRGFFREVGYVEEYRIKNRIQKKYYQLIDYVYSNQDDVIIEKMIFNIMSDLSRFVLESLN